MPPIATQRMDRSLEPESGGSWDHRRAAGVDGGDGLGVVDSLQVDGGDAEIGVLDMRVMWWPCSGSPCSRLLAARSGYVVDAQRRSP